MKPIDYIVTARNYSPDGTTRGYLLRQRDIIQHTRGIRLEIDETPAGTPLIARVERGQWIADCECGGATFVDPEWPFTFCFSCRANNGHLRPVTFPENWREIEQMLLARPVNDLRGLTENERSALSTGVIVVQGKGRLDRTWWPHEKLDDLLEQQAEPIRKWHAALKKGR
jgi:hypothetical protein